MKGQINIQYLIAIVVFIGIVWYLTFQITSMIPDFKIESQKNILQSKTYRLTENMVKTDGHPNNWETEPISSIHSIGLAKSSNSLDSGKVIKFKSLCKNHYDKVIDIFQSSSSDNTFSDFNFKLKGSTTFERGKKIPKGASTTIVSIKRWVKWDGDTAILQLTLW